MAIAQSEKDQLDERGFVILEDVVSLAMIDAVQTRIEQLFAEEGDGAGSEFKQEDSAAGWRTWWTRARSSARRSPCPSCLSASSACWDRRSS